MKLSLSYNISTQIVIINSIGLLNIESCIEVNMNSISRYIVIGYFCLFVPCLKVLISCSYQNLAGQSILRNTFDFNVKNSIMSARR